MTKEERTYTKYIKRHVRDVKNAWGMLQIKFSEEDFVKESDLRCKIDSLIFSHDASKLYPEEFDGYRQWFYPAKGEVRCRVKFMDAWEHHYKNNPHHAKYWEGKKCSIEKMKPYLIEMICDWVAMSVGDDRQGALEYFLKARTTLNLSDEVLDYLESILRRLENG